MKPLTVASIGFGRQTWTMLCMMALGEMERADLNIFADTNHENRATYDFIREQTPWLGEHGITVVTVEGRRTEVVLDDQSKGVLIPAFGVSNETGAHGQTRRQCTQTWKIAPIRKYIRGKLLRRGMKITPGCVELWQGISWDESTRMRESDVRYIVNRYPLVDIRMTVSDCNRWLQNHGLPIAPRSCCTFCPFSGIQSWKDRKAKGGVDWNEALEVDAAIRYKRNEQYGLLYVHPSRKPLQDAVGTKEDQGSHQIEMDFCDGYCRT